MAAFLRCPECGSAHCEVLTDVERKFNWKWLFSGIDGQGLAGYQPFKKTVLQQKGHCLDCGCVWGQGVFTLPVQSKNYSVKLIAAVCVSLKFREPLYERKERKEQ